LHWDQGHWKEHRNLPPLSEYPNDFGERGYYIGFVRPKYSYVMDEDNNPTDVLGWKFEKPGMGTRRGALYKVLSPEANNACSNILSEDTCSAADWLDKSIQVLKNNYSDTLMSDMLMRANVAMNYTLRAWCLWYSVKNDGELSKETKLTMLDSVVADCGLVTGKIFSSKLRGLTD
jgi:hypothetical protein